MNRSLARGMNQFAACQMKQISKLEHDAARKSSDPKKPGCEQVFVGNRVAGRRSRGFIGLVLTACIWSLLSLRSPMVRRLGDDLPVGTATDFGFRLCR